MIQQCTDLRAELLEVEYRTRDLMQLPAEGEVKANVMLAVRHIEDARMRLGKAIQHSEDGVSKFDREAGS